MTDDDIIIHSPLSRTVLEKEHLLRVEIYRSADSGWILEVVTPSNDSVVWSGEFTSDQDALDEFHRTLREEGVDVLLT
jgi:uncharacterized protein